MSFSDLADGSRQPVTRRAAQVDLGRDEYRDWEARLREAKRFDRIETVGSGWGWWYATGPRVNRDISALSILASPRTPTTTEENTPS